MIEVACAIIENNDKVLVAQRPKGKQLELKWEFPGGKLFEGESPEDCIYREIHEELGIEIKVTRALTPTSDTNGTVKVKLIPFICQYVSGVIVLNEHKAIRWVNARTELTMFDWCPADVPVVIEYLKYLRHHD